MWSDTAPSLWIKQHDLEPRRTSAIEVVLLIIPDNEDLLRTQLHCGCHCGEELDGGLLPADLRADDDVPHISQLWHSFHQPVQPMVEVGANAQMKAKLRQCPQYGAGIWIDAPGSRLSEVVVQVLETAVEISHVVQHFSDDSTPAS